MNTDVGRLLVLTKVRIQSRPSFGRTGIPSYKARGVAHTSFQSQHPKANPCFRRLTLRPLYCILFTRNVKEHCAGGLRVQSLRRSCAMRSIAHVLYTLLLAGSFLIPTTIIGLRGCNYYLTPLDERPFHEQYDTLKPSGFEGHGYGIVGSALLIFGVGMYSARKRIRAFAHWGKIANYLEFHIFLCLAGPMLIVYHSTFKLGGLVAVSFWSMVAVVASGVVGRYLYVQIPKGIKGHELSVTELEQENKKIAEILETQYQLNPIFLRTVDAMALPSRPASGMTSLEVLDFFFLQSIPRRRKLRHAFDELKRTVDPKLIGNVRRLLRRRITYLRRIAFLSQFRQMFHYWHVVHLPFAIVMFVIMFIHVGVAVAFGYTWVW